jgi:hypothetical protein
VRILRELPQHSLEARKVLRRLGHEWTFEEEDESPFVGLLQVEAA